MNKFKNALFLLLAKWLTTFSPGAAYLAFAGSGSAAQLCAHLRRSGYRRILVVTDKPLRELGIVDQALRGFEGSDVELAFYDGVEPDPTFDQGRAGTDLARRHEAEAVLAVGGGSAIDCAKLIAISATSEDDPRSWIGFARVKHEGLPIFAIPTTAGTGSEATMGAVITDSKTHEKSVISGSTLGPRAAALDPDLQLSLPPHITAATGMDALTHAIEAYICRWDRGTSKEQARRAIALIFANLRRAYAEPGDKDAREAMCMAAYYAGIAINQVNVGNVHALAHQLGARYGIPHGMANAIVLPPMLDFMFEEAEAALAELADLVGANRFGQNRRDRARAFIDAVIELRSDVGIGATSELIQRADFTRLTNLAVDEAVGYFSPRLLTADGARQVLAKISAA